MPSEIEDQIILKLILKGQDESDILHHLEKRDMVDPTTIYRVQRKIQEMKAAQAFLPHTPSFFERFSFILLGLFFVAAGGILAAWGWGFIDILGHYVSWHRGAGWGVFTIVVGLITIYKGIERCRW